MGFWWSKANWPAVKGEERRYPFFEDIRKFIFILENPMTGFYDIYKLYGKDLGSDNYAPYDQYNWAGSWSSYAAPGGADAGEIKVVYKDHTGAEDIYINHKPMTAAKLDPHPPIKSDGKLDTRYWRLGVNPNRYCHYNHNAGRPEIGANGRYIIIHHHSSPPPPTGCDFKSYVCDLKAHKWLPRHTHPYRQVSPVKYKSGEVKQRRDPTLYGVETKDKYISQSIGTEWDRSKDTVGYEKCTKPRRLTEYILEGGEPEDPGSGCEASGRCAHDPKMCEAYQDRVQRCVELNSHYLKKLESDDEYPYEHTYYYAEEWECTGGGKWWPRGSIVCKGTLYFGITLYVCLDSHTAITGDCKEPGTAAGADYWMTPAYQPTLFRDHPVYVELDNPYWRCNCSAFELLLHEIDSFDWWWDTKHPAMPWWLYENNFNDPASWPVPRGCWRRTWKHSMGRVGTRMWPQEKGEPPGHKKREFIVTQAVYDTIPALNKKYYAVSDVEALYDAAYTDEHEALIKERHDPKATSTAKVGEATIIEPHYKIHPDLVNDMWNILQLIHLTDGAGLTVTLYGEHWEAGLNMSWPTPLNRSASLPAYKAGILHCESEYVWDSSTNPSYTNYSTIPRSSMWLEIGYDAMDSYWPAYGSPPEPPFYVATNNYPMPGYFLYKDSFLLKVRKIVDSEETPLDMATFLLRVAYKGQGVFQHKGDGCLVGFQDKTFFANPEDIIEKNTYVGMGPGEIEIDAGITYWYYRANLLSPWPATEAGEYFDWAAGDYDRRWERQIKVDPSGYNMHNPKIVDMDWNKVPESVFEELETNFIKVKGQTDG